MKILQLAKYYPPIYGGIELVEKMMTKAHREVGDEVIIHAFDQRDDLNVGEFEEKIYRLKENFKILNAPFSLRYFFKFKKLIESNPVERIYLHLPNPFMHEVVRWNLSFLKKNNIEIWAIYHSDIVNKSFFGFLYNLYFKKTVNLYSRIIVSSDNLWNSSEMLNSLNKKMKKVIPFCIEEESVNVIPRDGSRKKLVSIGRFVPYKGFDFLINALNDSDYELHIIGNGPLLDQLQKLASKNVFIHTSLNHKEKNRHLAEADVVLIGSRNRAEAYGMTIVEAFYYGRPVLAANINTGVTFLVKNGITGLTFEVDNKIDFLNKLNEIIQNDNLRMTLSRNCKKFYDEELTFTKFKERLVEQ